MPRALIPAIAVILLACNACGPTPPPTDPARRATASATDVPAAATSPATTGRDMPLRYACDDGSVVLVTYGNEQARVELPDGRAVSLPKAQSASKEGGEVFVGETVSLQRESDGLQLFQTGSKSLQCRSAAPAE
ncbi:MAG: MliC family protein [Luteimonas sp.]|nr:MliC family protein [Luteimonas sp.]